MILIIKAVELDAILNMFSSLGAGAASPFLTLNDIRKKVGDVRGLLAKVQKNNRHGFTVNLPAGSTIEKADIKDMSLMIEFDDKDFVAITEVIIKHSPTIGAVARMYGAMRELTGTLFAGLSKDWDAVGSKIKFGSKIKAVKKKPAAKKPTKPAAEAGAQTPVH